MTIRLRTVADMAALSGSNKWTYGRRIRDGKIEADYEYVKGAGGNREMVVSLFTEERYQAEKKRCSSECGNAGHRTDDTGNREGC